MVVYVEYAFLENFLIDWLILYLATLTARGKKSLLRISFSAAVGGLEAVIFPMLILPVIAAYAVKILGGILLVLLAVKRESTKKYLVTGIAFFAYTFVFGGALTAIYSFAQIEYVSGQGYIVEKVPIGLLLSTVGIFAVGVVFLIRYAFAFRQKQCALISCTLKNGRNSLSVKGLVDSGNLLYFQGEPVSVLSPQTAYVLFGNETFAHTMSVTTVNGTRNLPLLRCQTVELGKSGKTVRDNALFAIANVPTNDYKMILHTAWVEGMHEDFSQTEIAVTKNNGE